jgi:HTH-type transcriptional regulator/antitoxin HipB
MNVYSVKDLGALVRSKRKAKGLTQAALAACAEVSTLWVSQFEAGKATAHIGLVLRTLKALDLQVAVSEKAEERGASVLATDLDSLLEGAAE